jgi:hypothetical protein
MIRIRIRASTPMYIPAPFGCEGKYPHDELPNHRAGAQARQRLPADEQANCSYAAIALRASSTAAAS